MADTTTTTTTTTAPLSDKDKLDQFFAKWGSTNKSFDESNKEDSFFREVYHSLQGLNKTFPTLYSYLNSSMVDKTQVANLMRQITIDNANVNNPDHIGDLNNLEQSGFYFTSILPSNLPYNSDYWFILNLTSGDQKNHSDYDVVLQVAWNGSKGNNDFYYRTAYLNKWTDWVQVVTKDLLKDTLSGYLKSTDASNTYLTKEIYNADISNYLKSTDVDAKYITQVSKTYSGDLNNLGAGGSYIIAPGVTNAPNATDYFFIHVQAQGMTAEAGVNQTATDIITGEVYSRVKALGHGWIPWSHMVTSDAMQAALDAKTVPVADEATATSNSTTNPTVFYLVPEAS